MTQLIPFSSQLSLIQNGNFAQGMASWFGSYVRHITTATNSPTAPHYAAQVFTGETPDYLDSIPAGINQFIDSPEAFTYPSRRVVNLLNMRVLGSESALLSINASTTFLDGTTASLSNHPFVFTDQYGSVSVETGTSILLTEFTGKYSGEYRTGKPKPIKNSSGQVVDYVLPVSLTKKPAALLSVESFPNVYINISGLLPSVGTGVAALIGDESTLLLIKDFDRGDGTTGFRIGDTIVFNDLGYSMTVTTVATQLNTSAPPFPSYNLAIAPIPGVPSLPSGAVSRDWSFYPTTFTTAAYSMNIYKYDYTLAYTYSVDNAGPPNPAKLTTHTFSGETIQGIGQEGLLVPSVTNLKLDIQFQDNAQWRRRFEYLSKETSKPADGRLLLTIPPAGFFGFIDGDPVEVTGISYLTSTGRARIDYVEYGEPGAAIVSMNYNQALGKLTVVGLTPMDVSVGNVAYVYGYAPSMPVWLRTIVETRQGMFVNSYNSSTYTAELLLVTTGNLSPYSVTGLSTTPMRISTVRPSQVKLKHSSSASWALRLAGSVPAPWTQPLFDRSSTIVTNPTVGLYDFTKAELSAYVDWPGVGPVQDESISVVGNGIEVGLAGGSDSNAVIGDISLWKGYHFYRMNSTDTADVLSTDLGTNVSIDLLLNRVDTLGNVVPKGTIVLYAGGGVCPTGYKPVVNERSAAANNQGLTSLSEIPWPTAALYDSASDTTTLDWPFTRFDQRNPDGSLILKDGNVRYITINIPGITVASAVPVTRQITVQQAKQYVEPGMFLRAAEQVYVEGRSSLIDSGTGMTPVDLYGPFAESDSSFLVTDLELTVGAEATSGNSAKSFVDASLTTVGTKSTYGRGKGSVSYPSLVRAEFIARPSGGPLDHDVQNGFTNIPPPGPAMADQTEIFLPSRPYAFLAINRLDDDNGTFRQLRCRLVTFSDEVSVPGSGNIFTVPVTGTSNTVLVNVANDAFRFLNQDESSPDALKQGDVYFARMYCYPATGANLPMGTPPNVVPTFHDSFFVKLKRVTADSWDLYRYDDRSMKLYDLGNIGNYKRTNIIDGGENLVRNGFVVLQPAKLYGTPDMRQILKATLPANDPRTTSPQGSGEGFLQQKTTVDLGTTQEDDWVTSIVQVGTRMTVTGNLSTFVGDTSKLIIEPSGYLRYDDPDTVLDYGASGHRHFVEDNTDLILDNVVPRVLSRATLLSHYPPIRLPSEHGHGQLGAVEYAMPAAHLFTLCLKL